MLNRRFLRIKVYHALYAYWQSEDASAARIEKELLNGIDRVRDIFLGLMLTFGELRHVAELRMEERRRKRLPTPDDLAPNRRFIDDPVLAMLAGSERLQQECQRRKVSWVGEQELFVRMFREVETSPTYMTYMNDPSPSFRKSLAFLLDLFTEHVANDPALQDLYEGRSIHWLEDLDLAASMVKRCVEQLREGEARALELTELDSDPAEEYEFVTQLFRRSIALGDEHEKAIAERASNWESDRIALSDMILMKMALAEVRSFDQIPIKVTLNEYIEIAKAYSTPKSKGFINGVLDKIFIDMKAKGSIRKVGRGLLES